MWTKKEASNEIIKDIHKRYGCDLLTAAILARRGVIKGADILFFLEDDLRYQHNPFLFASMEDAVDRILQAQDEGEKVLVFGDRDADGVTSTALLTAYLRELGIDVSWKVPTGDEAYGLTKAAVADFAAAFGTLIITVDCGISNREEIALASECGIDVIVADHHNPPSALPENAIIINPKMPDSGYPFQDISGCAVAYKIVSALRFARSELYKQEICLLNVRPITDAYSIDCMKVVNMTNRDVLTETIVPGGLSFQETRLAAFLQGQQIFAWDADLQKKQLEKIFGKGVEFNLFDLRSEIAKFMPKAATLSLLKLKDMSKIAKYDDSPAGELDTFFNLLVTYIRKASTDAGTAEREKLDLELVTLAALADIMPAKNENRIFARQGLAAINGKLVRQGLLELLSRQNLLTKRLSSTDLSWTVIPALNAAGRLGKPELAVNLFLSDDPQERSKLAEEIVQLNVDRRALGDEAWSITEQQSYDSLTQYGGNLCVVVDKRINRGITGILASKLAQLHKTPAIAIAIMENNAVGSMRSVRGYDVMALLDRFSDIFIAYGGHNFAAGFSLPESKLGEFTERLKTFAQLIEFDDKADDETMLVDAEIPHEYMTPDLLNLVDRFEPYGAENGALQFLVNGAKIVAADLMGKTEKKHLKLTLQCGKYKWPVLYWNAAERWGRDFSDGDTVNVVFTVSRNTFNGAESAQMIASDVQRA